MTTFFIYAGGDVPSESVFTYFLGGDVSSDVSVRINLENQVQVILRSIAGAAPRSERRNVE